MKPSFPEMPENKAFALELPKWPQFLMTGKDLMSMAHNIGLPASIREHGIRDEICDQYFARVRTWVDANRSRIEEISRREAEGFKKRKKT